MNVSCMLQCKGVTLQAFQHVTVIYDHLGARGARSGQQLCDSVGGAGKLPDLNVTSLMRTHHWRKNRGGRGGGGGGGLEPPQK